MKPQKENKSSKNPVYKMVLLGLFFALAMVLSLAESVLLPALPMGVKLGLSNIIVMYCLFFMGGEEAVTIAVLKSLFVAMVRSPVSAVISLSGGLISVFTMCLLKGQKPEKTGYLLISVLGALAHNVGQLTAVAIIMRSPQIGFMLPLLVVSGCVVGSITGGTLKVLMPYVKRVTEQFERS